MQLTKINGNTYYLPGPTNIGLFQFKDKYTLLIDSGDNNQQARKIAEVIQAHGLNIRFVANTHHHPDHAGGNLFFQEHYPGSLFLAADQAPRLKPFSARARSAALRQPAMSRLKKRATARAWALWAVSTITSGPVQTRCSRPGSGIQVLWNNYSVYSKLREISLKFL